MSWIACVNRPAYHDFHIHLWICVCSVWKMYKYLVQYHNITTKWHHSHQHQHCVAWESYPGTPRKYSLQESRKS